MGYFSEEDLARKHPDHVSPPKPRGKHKRISRYKHIEKMRKYKRERRRGRPKKVENAAAGMDYVPNIDPAKVRANVAKWFALAQEISPMLNEVWPRERSGPGEESLQSVAVAN